MNAGGGEDCGFPHAVERQPPCVCAAAERACGVAAEEDEEEEREGGVGVPLRVKASSDTAEMAARGSWGVRRRGTGGACDGALQI